MNDGQNYNHTTDTLYMYFTFHFMKSKYIPNLLSVT